MSLPVGGNATTSLLSQLKVLSTASCCSLPHSSHTYMYQHREVNTGIKPSPLPKTVHLSILTGISMERFYSLYTCGFPLQANNGN